MTRANLNRRAFLGTASASALTLAARPLYAAEQEEPKGGIGGTGIVGTLTDFGSLMVNGKRIVLTPDTDISGPLGAISEADLAIGQALTIEAQGLTAARVFVADPVIGRVKSADVDNRKFWVDGLQVTSDPTSGPLPSAGQRVAVSGLWRGDEIIATRITPSTSPKSAIAGVFRTEQGALPRIGTERIFLPKGIAEPADGTFVVVRGDHQAGAFFVDTMDAGRFTGAAGPLTALSVEGYLDPIKTAPFFEVAGLGHSFDAAAKLDAFAAERTIFEGAYTGAFEVVSGLIMPAAFQSQRQLLRSGGQTAKAAR